MYMCISTSIFCSSQILTCIFSPYTLPAYCTELQKNICETNCIDFSFPYCREESIYDCGCREEDERYSGNSCIDKSNCGCYNMNTTTLIAAGEKITTGCSEWSVRCITTITVDSFSTLFAVRSLSMSMCACSNFPDLIPT